MSQEVRVLHCFNCDIFQVDIVKKSKKWKCRVCGVQQTVRKVHFRGTGSECRTKVQELNMEKGQQQKKDLKNNAEDVHEYELYNCNTDNSNASYCEQHLENKLKSIKEDAHTMFNFSNTQKWTKRKLVLPSSKSFGPSNILDKDVDSDIKKKSKWDNYV